MTDQTGTTLQLISLSNCALIILISVLLCSSVVRAQPKVKFELIGQITFESDQPFRIRKLAVDSQDRVLVLWYQEPVSLVSRCQQDGTCEVVIVIIGGSVISMTVDPQDRVLLGTGRFPDLINLIVICQESVPFPCEVLFGGSGSTPGLFDGISDLAVDSQERIIITDTQNDRVQICSYDGTCTVINNPNSPLSQFCGPADATTHFCRPRSVTVDSNDRIIVADTDNKRIMICDDQGECTAFGAQGTALGEFNGWPEVAVDNRDRIVVSDELNSRVQVCNDQGECTAFDARDESGVAIEPFSLVVDSQNRIIFTASEDSNIQQIVIVRILEEFGINPGLNGSWANFDTLGQGFFIDVLPDIPLIFLAWFTWETSQASPAQNKSPLQRLAKSGSKLQAVVGDENHRWLTAQGPFSGNSAVLDVTLTTGGLFDDPHEVTNSEMGTQGTMTLTFTDCKNGTVDYNFTAIGLSGSVPIQRLANDNVALCETMDGIDDDPQ